MILAVGLHVEGQGRSEDRSHLRLQEIHPEHRHNGGRDGRPAEVESAGQGSRFCEGNVHGPS